MDAGLASRTRPVFRTTADAKVKVPAWLNDPTMYHNRGDSTFAGENSEYGDFFGLDDLWTERPEVVEGMTRSTRLDRRLGIDGFRIDTVKHVNMEFWPQFAPAHPGSTPPAHGNEDFFMFGEVFSADPDDHVAATRPRASCRRPSTSRSRTRRAASPRGGPADRPARPVRRRTTCTPTRDTDAYALPTFLGNHDMGRIGSFIAQATSAPATPSCWPATSWRTS